MKTALVLSGGGAKGAFQVGAERYLREVEGLSWDIVSGVSVGALNGAMISTGRQKELQRFWQEIKRSDILAWPSPLDLFRTLIGRRAGLFSQRRLVAMIEEALDGASFESRFRFGVSDLETGNYISLTEEAARPKMLAASATIPVIYPPIEGLVDGAVLNNGPLGDVVSMDPDLVVIINCRPRQVARERPPKSPWHLLSRVYDMMRADGFASDYREFLRINDLVRQSTRPLFHSSGRRLKSYRTVVVEPEYNLGEVFDFSAVTIRSRIEAGAAYARRAWRQL